MIYEALLRDGYFYQCERTVQQNTYIPGLYFNISLKQFYNTSTVSSIRNYEYCNSSLIFFTFLIMCARVTHFNRVECLVCIKDNGLTYF